MEGYKKKYMILLISIPVILILIYRLTISGTIKMGSDIGDLESDIEKSSMAPANIARLSRELDYLKKRMGGTSDIRGEQGLFTHVADYCKKNRLHLKSFPSAHKINTIDYNCITSVICVEGSYKQLLKLIHYFEYKKHLLLRSVSFDLVKDRISRKEKLQLKIFVQTVDYGKD